MYKITITNLQNQFQNNQGVIYTSSFLKVFCLHFKVAMTFFRSYRKVGKVVLNTRGANETSDGSAIMTLGVLLQEEICDILEVKLQEVEELEDDSFSFA